VIAAVFAASYGAVLSNRLAGAPLVLAVVVMHYAMFLSTIGIAHDATHGAWSRSRRVNRIVGRGFDLVGIDAAHWIDNHLRSHHAAPNVPDVDSAIESFALVRLHPRAPWRPWHRWQHVYMFGVYALVTIFQVYLLELVSFRQHLVGFRARDTRGKVLAMIGKKLFFLGYSLLVPLAIVLAPAWQVVLGALLGHVAGGLTIGIVFQTTHLAEGTTFPTPDARGALDLSFSEHVLATTAEFAVESPIVTWIAGGLNLHVTHHLFPHVSQVHLPALSRIVRETAREHGVPYRSFGLVAAIRSHVRVLRALGASP
jgi:linoleoyl-CoA desaturase